MKKLRHNGHSITIFDSIEGELSIRRFQAFNRYITLEAGIGSDLPSIMVKIENASRYISLGKYHEAKNELSNMAMAFQFIMNNVSPEMMAFACLTSEVDGKPFNDITEHGLKECVDKLSKTNIPISIFKSWLDISKKKLTMNYGLFSRN